MVMNRRGFVRQAAALGAMPLVERLAQQAMAQTETATQFGNEPSMTFGLVTYLWGKDMDLPTLIRACEQSGLLGIELRTEHRHGVEPELSKAERSEVRRRFQDSPTTLVGYGSNAQFHDPDPAQLQANIERTKAYVQLMHDCGGTGVKVKPNQLVDGVPHEQTITQIGRALNEVAAYGARYGQQIRVEVHGQGTSELPIMQAILAIADHPNATICWNSNGSDLHGQGLRHNFNLVKDRLGSTVHVRELNSGDYPYAELLGLLAELRYQGWILLEGRTEPADRVSAMTEQRAMFARLTGR
ncbi:MAG: xylose isomerase [Planctomycetes bacterium RBG_16_64_10]|nr:MAG: xylose isomerase [Planctomycetes bacterium RBG_16_64_10]